MPPYRTLEQSDLRRLYDALVKPNPEAITARFYEVIDDLATCIDGFKTKGGESIPSFDYADLENIKPGTELHERVKTAGCAVVKNVVPGDICDRWLDGLADNLNNNPNYGPDLKANAIARIHWSKPQIEARAYPPIIKTASMMSSLFWSNPPDAQVSLATNITYEDRFRYQPAGMASWRMGAHIDSPGTDCWARDSVRKTYDPLLSNGSYKDMNLFDTANKIAAYEDIEHGWRSWQASVTLTEGAPGLALFPNLKLGMGYTLLVPFFTPKDASKTGEAFLAKDNWRLRTEEEFLKAGAALKTGLDEAEHPHLRLWQGGMVPVPKQHAGSYMFWHNDLIHSVFPIPDGQGISSVVYIPSAPLCRANARHLVDQRDAFLKSIPGVDMRGDPIVETGYEGTGDLAYLKSLGQEALRNMGFEKFPESGSEGEIKLKQHANKLLFSSPITA